MTIYKVKLRKADRLFTELVRLTYNYTCQKCGRVYIPGVHSLQNLGVSHYYGRKRESVRFDLDNVTLLCNMPCHHEWERDREGYTAYMIKRLGQLQFDLLTYRANQIQRRDDELIIRWIQREIEKIG